MNPAPVPRILYMEDDAGLARLLQKSLRRQGFDVDTAPDGGEGLRLATEQRYDMLIVDYNMPIRGGLEVVDSLARGDALPPTIMLTGAGNEEVAVQALKLGVADYIVKDVDLSYMSLLPMVIEQVLTKMKLQQEREMLFAAMKESEERYRLLVDLSLDGIAILEGDRIGFVNPAGIDLLRAPGAAELAGQSLFAYVDAVSRPLVEGMFAELERGEPVHWMELTMLRWDGVTLDVELAAVPFRQRGLHFVQCIFRDITERKMVQRRLQVMALYDSLTGMPNRILFADRLRQALALADRQKQTAAVFFMDLDRFKQVNDTLGHDKGDALLREAAQRLQGCIRKSDTLARMGGDEFMVILTNITGAEEAQGVAQSIIAAFAEPFVISGHRCDIGISIGIALYPYHAATAEQLVKNADIAMYHVKEGGRNGYRFFVPQALPED